MGIVRNFIDIIGITPEDELPRSKNGNIVMFSEAENIVLPEEREGIDTIYQIMIDLETKTDRKISTPLGRIQVLDGIKKFKIIYSGKENEGQLNIINLIRPFNTFIDLPVGMESENIKVFILDAYFELIDQKRIYSHFLYMVEIKSNSIVVKNSAENNSKKISLSNYRPVEIDDMEGINVENYIIEEVSISNEGEKLEAIKTYHDFKHEDSFDIDSEYL